MVQKCKSNDVGILDMLKEKPKSVFYLWNREGSSEY